MCHLFLLLFFSLGLGLNFLGGVSACPKSPQISQRKIRTSALDTPRLRRRPQKPHRPFPIGLLERFALSFTVFSFPESIGPISMCEDVTYRTKEKSSRSVGGKRENGSFWVAMTPKTGGFC